jgi:signal recognition particle subunit SRP54
MNDLADQLRQLEKMGGMGGVMKMLPGMGKLQKQLEGVDLDKNIFKGQMAIIGSMTKRERANPKIIDGKRRKRIAAGSGTKVEEVNKLLKMHVQMADMMKQMGQGKGMFGKMFGGKGLPSETEMEKMRGELARMDPNSIPPELREMMNAEQGGAGSAPKMPDFDQLMKGLPGGGLPKLPGLGALPGLGGGFKGLPGLGKKK